MPSDTLTERLARGTVVADRYVIDGDLGEGATGIVYAAHRASDHVRVALKVIHRHVCYDEQALGRFQREATILKQLEGNHIVRLLDIAVHDELPVLVLEYVEGRSLEAALRAGAPTLDQAVEITLQICAALGAAHAGGFVHRDLKPGNVIVQGELGGARIPMVWVVDFGLGKALHRETSNVSMTDRGIILGTPEYMSPEQVDGEGIDHRCDIYAAGVILFELLTGRLPYRGQTAISTMTSHLNDPVPSARSVCPERGISPALDAVVSRALAKAAADRYPTARAFAEALAAARREAHVVAPRSVSAEDAKALAEKDTELELRDAAKEAKDGAEIIRDKRAEIRPAVPSVPASMPKKPWAAVVVVTLLAIVVIVVGAVMGSR
ncbi:MAG TPA: serine/threonine-protein kinase [Polyangium sp.]|nr:serine/threonine-protein kinase [Polyangium sp.]